MLHCPCCGYWHCCGQARHSSGRVVRAGGVKQKRCGAGGRIAVSGLRSSAPAPTAVLKLPVVLAKSESDDRGIEAASGGALKCVCPSAVLPPG